ncbi:hypothetical protein [Pseudonocardia lacus]|uniref:hypothetical protein n=1 Tax=Pseudonocardia lacus TaxID=2835865 RepID=UPI001BDC35CF|nr:hypothetical protein [Pseudonocardia lacus]
MSSETDQPRQRTVAELLAQHGGSEATSTGRRRRRRDADDVSDDQAAPTAQSAPTANGSNGSNGSNGAAWPTSRSPQPERPSGPPPPSLAGPAGARESGPRPPSAMPQQYASPGADFPGGNGAPNGSPNGAPNGSPNSAPNGSPNGRGAGQWGAGQQRREPDRGWQPDESRDATGAFRPDAFRPEPQRERPAPGWDQPDQPRPDHPAAPWDAQGRPGGGQRGPQQFGPREQPPRAFPPAPEQMRPGGPPHSSTPYAGGAPLAASALPAPMFGPPSAGPNGQPNGQPNGRPPFEPQAYGRPGADPNLTGPIDHQRLEALRQSEATSRVQAAAPRVPVDDGGPATAVGMPPAGAEDWHRDRTGQGAPPATDGGPPTEAAAPMDFDEFDDDAQPAGLGPSDAGPDLPTGARTDSDDDEPAADGADAVEEEGTAQSWAPVLAQWVVGAIGGAALWVGFRYLWSSLLVVAIAAAILVTAGLVVVVRTLLRNTDMRTTIAAVLVGVLLTVSPAILVLLGR